MVDDDSGLLAKYSWLPKLLVVAALAAGVLVLAPSAQSQAPARDCITIPFNGDFCLEKTVSRDPATVGEPITFTIREVNESIAPVFDSDPLVDALPPGLRDVSVSQKVTPGSFAPPCTVRGNTIECPGRRVFLPGGILTLTIVATPTECGDFLNTASEPAEPPDELKVEVPFTVVGCEEAPQQQPQQPHQPQPQQPVCPPASQELGNEAESGNVDLSGDVTSSGNSSNQTAAPLDFGNSGSDQNAQGVLQTCGSTADDAELKGGSMEFSPALNTLSEQGVGESSASQQG